MSTASLKNADTIRQSQAEPYGRLFLGLLAIHLFAAALAVLRPAIRDADHFVQVRENGVRIQDFAGHLMFTKSFWSGHGDYGLEGHMRVMRDWTGQEVPYALPYGYSPTMFMAFGPFAVFRLPAAYVLWVASSILACLYIIRNCQSDADASPLVTTAWKLAAAMVVLGPVGVACLGLGQTALVSTAGVLFLVIFSQRSAKRSALPVVVLWLLTAKPPLALAAGVGLLASRRFYEVSVAVVLTLLSTTILSHWLAPGWIHDYIELVTTYDTEQAHRAYAWSLHPDQMANLRRLLTGVMGLRDSFACGLSNAVWLCSMVGIVVGSWRRIIPSSYGWALAIMSYLLFCPHVSFTELTLLAVPIVLLARGAFSLQFGARIACTLAIVLCGALPISNLAARSILVLCVEALVVAILIVRSQRWTPNAAT